MKCDVYSFIFQVSQFYDLSFWWTSFVQFEFSIFLVLIDKLSLLSLKCLFLKVYIKFIYVSNLFLKVNHNRIILLVFLGLLSLLRLKLNPILFKALRDNWVGFVFKFIVNTISINNMFVLHSLFILDIRLMLFSDLSEERANRILLLLEIQHVTDKVIYLHQLPRDKIGHFIEDVSIVLCEVFIQLGKALHVIVKISRQMKQRDHIILNHTRYTVDLCESWAFLQLLHRHRNNIFSEHYLWTFTLITRYYAADL